MGESTSNEGLNCALGIKLKGKNSGEELVQGSMFILCRVIHSKFEIVIFRLIDLVIFV